jgi:signal transduction histidine kinase
MQSANRETRRGDFLRALSKLLLQFSGCDALELRLRGNVEYRWRAVSRPEESFVFEPSRVGELEDGSTLSEVKGMPRLTAAIHDELEGVIDPAAECFTPSGSFWTGDLAQTVFRHSSAKGIRLNVFPGANSVALVPFAIDVNNFGILRLECSRRNAFSLDTIESYEVVGETLGLAIAQRRSQAALHERVKELACLYGIARIVEDSTASVDEAIERIVKLLPPGWQFSESAVARITLDGKEYATGGFEAARSRQVAEIMVNGQCRGTVEVGYIIDVAEAVNGVFLKEEAHLIEGVAREIGEFLDRRQAAVERLNLEAQLRHADRLATIGQLAAGVAHEINEPLGSILGYAQLAQKGGEFPESTAEDLNKIIAASLQAREIVNKLRLFARQAPIQKVPVSIARILDEALSLVENRCANEGIALVRHVEEGLPDVPAAPVQLKQVVVNLVVNAMQAMPGGGILTVSTRFDHSSAVVEIEDNGVGMTEDVMDQIFNPFFTTKDVGEGTGLGLSVVHGIVSAHGGTIDVESEEGKGSKFTVRLPYRVGPGTGTPRREKP